MPRGEAIQKEPLGQVLGICVREGEVMQCELSGRSRRTEILKFKEGGVSAAGAKGINLLSNAGLNTGVEVVEVRICVCCRDVDELF